MLVISDVAGDSRVVREASTLADAGHSVHVIGRGVPAGWEPPPGVTVSSVGGGTGLKRPAGAPARGPLPPHLRTARWLLLPRHRATVHRTWTAAAWVDGASRAADVVHAHDFNTLALGTRLAAAHGARLVYDTHEFWSGRPRIGRPTPVAVRRDLAAEGRLGGAADAVITVGQGVADELQGSFSWPSVAVVRNTFPLPETEPALPDAPTGLVYAGRLAPFRELEVVAAAAAQLAPLQVTAVGPSDPTWLASYARGVVDVRPSLPLPEAEALLTQAGLALVTHSDRWVNHRLALPNKLFLAARAGVPVVATDVQELSRVVRAHGIGTLYRPGDAADLVRAVREAVDRWPELVAAVRRARPALSWEVDGQVLREVYARLDGEDAPRSPVSSAQ